MATFEQTDVCGSNVGDMSERTEHLACDMLLEFSHPLPSQSVDLRLVHNFADSVHRRLVNEQLNLV